LHVKQFLFFSFQTSADTVLAKGFGIQSIDLIHTLSETMYC